MNALKTPVSYSGSIPKIYDEILGPCYFEPFAIETARRVAACKPQKILEIACGTGRVTNRLQKNLPDAEIMATDISADMIAVAVEKLSGTKNISWKVADALDLPFEDDEFDVIVCQFGVMFFADRKKGVAEAWRVLKDGGTFIMTVWDKLSMSPIAASGRQIMIDFFEGHPPQGLKTAYSMADKKEIEELLEEAGFKNIQIESVNKRCETDSAEKLAFAMVDGSIVLNFIREKDAEAVPVLRKKIAETIVENFGNHPVRSTMQAILATGEKNKK
jgi:ubiquinone/menaquinone biosynthesis C-methylase UbiE